MVFRNHMVNVCEVIYWRQAKHCVVYCYSKEIKFIFIGFRLSEIRLFHGVNF